MSQEPWNEEIYETVDNEDTSPRSRSSRKKAGTTIFTVLLSIFIILVATIIALSIYLSIGGSKTNSSQEFYRASQSTSESSSSSVASSASTQEASGSDSSSTSTSATETSTSSTTATEDGSTLTVNAGEGEASIAARAGISIAQLESLNPDKMTTGSWFANPGDVVRIK